MNAVVSPFDVVVVGNAGIDTNVYLADPPDLDHETDYTDNVDGVGQSGGYSARGFARLGYRTAFLGYVGDDTMGQFLVDELTSDGVDMAHVLVDPAGTNRSVNLMSPDGQRHSFFDGKSHMTLTPDVEAWQPVLNDAALIHFSIPNWARRVLPAARAAGAVVSVDIQDVRDLDDPYRRDFIDAADVLFVSSAHVSDPRGALDALHRPGQIAVCAMGARGCAVRCDDGYREHRAVSLPAPIVDTNGAGDSLAAAMLAAYVLDGRSLDEAVIAANWRPARAARFAAAVRSSPASNSMTSTPRADGDHALQWRCANRGDPPQRDARLACGSCVYWCWGRGLVAWS